MTHIQTFGGDSLPVSYYQDNGHYNNEEFNSIQSNANLNYSNRFREHEDNMEIRTSNASQDPFNLSSSGRLPLI